MKRVEQIHEQALEVARRYKTAEIELIEMLQVVGEKRVFLHYKFNSLFQYAVSALGLSEEVAYIFINVSRKVSQVPALKTEIAAGNITVSKAKVISSVLTTENQDHWLEIAKTSTKRQIEKQVAMASPKDSVREAAKYVSGSFMELKVGVSEELMLKLRHVQDLVSQSKQTHASLQETLEVMANLYITKKDPLEKARRQKAKGRLSPGPVFETHALNRRPISAAIKHSVYLRFGGQCTHLDDQGVRCSQKRLLEIHHLVPVSDGGNNDPDNLTLLCDGHHRALHLSG